MIELYPHQKEAVAKLHNGAILWGETGDGKSLVGVAYYLEKEAPKDVYVITTAKKRNSKDWETEFAKLGVGREAIPGYSGSLQVDSWNNIGNYRGITEGFFIFDEQRLVGNGHWTDTFLRIAKNNRWILLSATPGDTWLDYIPVFIANGYYKNRTEFKREHVVYNTHTRFPKVERYIGLNRLVRQRNELLVEMPYRKHTVRHSAEVLVDYDRDLFEKVAKRRWNVFEERPLRDVSELFMVMRKVVNSSPTRLKAIQDLMKKHPRLIVFYNFDFELEILLSLVSLVPTYQYNGHRHDQIPSGDRWLYLVQYAAGSEGWNCTTTDAVCFYSMTYSYKQWHQAHGRIDRLNTPYLELYYYTLTTESIIDQGITKALKNKKSFNESHFLRSNSIFKF